MTLTTFEDFRAHVLRTPALQQVLQRHDDPYDFPAVVVSLGAQEGFVFTEADVRDAMRDARRTWYARATV